jgi:hypothetical protein
MTYSLVSSGLLTPEHRCRMGIAVWVFLWLVDHEFRSKTGGPNTGLVLNGCPITAGRIGSELGLSVRTVQRNLETLEAEKYIRTEDILGIGKRYFIVNPKRWKSSTHDRNVTPTHDTSVTGAKQKCLDPHDKNVMPNKEQDFQDDKTLKPIDGVVFASLKEETKEKPAFDASTMEIPAWLPQDAWTEFVEHRREKKKPLTEREARANIRVLTELWSKGQDPRKVIDQTIASGWPGLYELRTRYKTQKAHAPTVDAPDSYELTRRDHLRVRALQTRIL